jgi:hypothetical protein
MNFFFFKSEIIPIISVYKIKAKNIQVNTHFWGNFLLPFSKEFSPQKWGEPIL